MKLSVAKPDLEAALSVAAIAVGSGSDISSHYLFRLVGGKVSVLTYDMRLFSSSPMVATADGKEGEAFTVEAWRLNQWVAGIPDGVVNFTADGGGDVHVSSGRSKVRFRSLDPAKFPYWDGLIQAAKEVGVANPESLSRALSLARWFVSADDTSKPEICQIEAKNGVLWSTDRRALSAVELPTLPGLNIRIPGKDVGSIVKFLSEKNTREDSVTIKEAERPLEAGGGACALFERPDGSYVGVTKPTSSFPVLNADRNAESDCTMTLDRAEFSSAVDVLSAGAPKNHGSVSFLCDNQTSTVTLSMPCEAGGSDEFPLLLAKVTGGDKFTAPLAFTVDFSFIQGIGDTFGLDNLEFGVTKFGRGGFISFRYTDPSEKADTGNRYFSVIVWRT